MQGTKGAYSNEPETKKVRKRQHKKPLTKYWGGGKWRLREDEEGSRQHVLIERVQDDTHLIAVLVRTRVRI